MQAVAAPPLGARQRGRRSALLTSTTSIRGTRARAWPAWLRPSLADLLLLGCVLVALWGGSVMLSADGDPARHLTVGEHILASGAIPHADVFSHTMAGQPFVPYEWLAEVASALSYRLAGLAGPVLLHGMAIGLSFAVLFRHLRHRGHPVVLALAVTLLAAMASTLHWLARPHVFTFLGTAVFSFVLDGWHAGRLRSRWLWALAPAMALWANVHGGFLIGFILLGAYAGADALHLIAGDGETRSGARRRLARLGPPALATLGATLLNPAGPELLAHVTGYLDKKLLVDRTHEYMSPDFHQPSAIFFLAMLLMTLGAMMWSRRRPALHEGLLLLGFTYFALHSARNIPLFAIVVAPVLASQLRAATQPLRLGRRASAFLAASGDWVTRRNAAYARLDRGARGHVWPLVVLAVLLYVAGAQHRAGEPALGLRFDPARQPVGAAAYLKAHLPAGNGFNDLRWGGYLLRELWPAQRVFIDGQTDFYGEALTREYLRVVELGAAGDEVLQRHDVTWVVYPAGTPLVRHLLASGQWRVAYVDATASVLIRVASAEQPHASD